MRKEQVEALLDYSNEPMKLPKQVGATKGIIENPWLKIELTKANGFCETKFWGAPQS
jgi:hypothetical protein